MCARTALPIGFKDVGIYDQNLKWHPQPFVVIREVTREDWEDYCHSQGVKDLGPEPETLTNFYEVSVD